MPDLIALSDLQTITKLNNAVEERKAGPCIEDVHIEVEKVLGKTGYALVYANAPTFAAQGSGSATYVTLLNSYIKPFMAWRARERGIVDMYAEPDRAGVYVKEGNEHRAVSRSELGMLQGQYAARADMRLERLLKYLEDNKAVFTWFAEEVEGEDRITTTNSAGPSGISFREGRSQETYRG